MNCLLTPAPSEPGLLAQIAVGAAEGEGGARPAELAVRALEAADASGDPQALVEAIAARHLAISVPQTVTERLELGRRVIEVGATLGRTMPALWGHLWRADASLQLGNLAEFDHELGEIDRVARTRRSVLARWHHHRFTATRAVLLGDYASARAADGAAFELACQVGDFSLLGMSYAFRGLLAGVRGDPADLAPHWYETLAAAPPMPLIKVAIPTALALLGRIDEARAAFEPFRALPATFPAGVRWAATVGQVGKTAVLLEDGEVAGAAHDALADTAAYYSGDGSGGIFSFGANAGMLGDFALAAGRLDPAIEHYRTAIGLNRRIGARPYVALAQLGEAVVLRRTGAEPDVAAAALAEAGAEFVRLDLPGPLAQAVALGYRRARDATPPSPLTTRESEIATLVADALSNREIAVRLVLSERTVEAHVRSILAKLGFTTRTEIATWQVRLGR